MRRHFPRFLRIAVVPRITIIYLNQTEDGEYRIIGGPEGELIRICSQFFGFSYRVVPAPDKTWGSLGPDGQWSGAIGLIQRGEADIGISRFGASELRRRYVYYSYPYSLEDLTFVTRQPGLRSSIDAPVRPFSPGLWLAVVASVLAVSVALAFLQKRVNLAQSTYRAFAILVSQAPRIRRSSSGWSVAFAWTVASMLLAWCYVAVLLSFLTVPVLEKGAETVDELSAALPKGTYQAGVYRGAMLLDDLKESSRQTIRDIAQHIVDRDHFIEPRRDVVLNAIRNEKMALIGPSDTLRLYLQYGFFLSKDSFKTHESGIVTNKSFCCKEELGDFVHVLTASGIYHKLVTDEIFLTGLRARQQAASGGQTGSSARSLSIVDVSGAFVLIAAGHVLAIFVALGEVVYFRMCALTMTKMR